MLLVVLATVCKPNAEAVGKPPEQAWWVDIVFDPTGEAVQGIPVKEIDPEWRKASVLEPAALDGRISKDEKAQFLASRMGFSLSADLDGDGAREEFVVGVYESADGAQGRFVLITKNGKPVQHFTESGTAGFSALLPSDDAVDWYKCMQCGEFEAIRWTGEGYALE